jgi:hypothetical protein
VPARPIHVAITDKVSAVLFHFRTRYTARNDKPPRSHRLDTWAATYLLEHHGGRLAAALSTIDESFREGVSGSCPHDVIANWFVWISRGESPYRRVSALERRRWSNRCIETLAARRRGA